MAERERTSDGRFLRLSDEERKARRKTSVEKYLASEKGKANQRRNHRKFMSTEKGYAANRRYDASEKRKIVADRRLRDPLAQAHARARAAVFDEERSGRLVRPTTCTRCGVCPRPGRDGRSSVEAHHYLSYEQEHHLDIVWLCRKCHRKIDAFMPHEELGTKTMAQRKRVLGVFLASFIERIAS